VRLGIVIASLIVFVAVASTSATAGSSSLKPVIVEAGGAGSPGRWLLVAPGGRLVPALPVPLPDKTVTMRYVVDAVYDGASIRDLLRNDTRHALRLIKEGRLQPVYAETRVPLHSANRVRLLLVPPVDASPAAWSSLRLDGLAALGARLYRGPGGRVVAVYLPSARPLLGYGPAHVDGVYVLVDEGSGARLVYNVSRAYLELVAGKAVTAREPRQVSGYLADAAGSLAVRAPWVSPKDYVAYLLALGGVDESYRTSRGVADPKRLVNARVPAGGVYERCWNLTVDHGVYAVRAVALAAGRGSVGIDIWLCRGTYASSPFMCMNWGRPAASASYVLWGNEKALVAEAVGEYRAGERLLLCVRARGGPRSDVHLSVAAAAEAEVDRGSWQRYTARLGYIGLYETEGMVEKGIPFEGSLRVDLLPPTALRLGYGSARFRVESVGAAQRSYVEIALGNTVLCSGFTHQVKNTDRQVFTCSVSLSPSTVWGEAAASMASGFAVPLWVRVEGGGVWLLKADVEAVKLPAWCRDGLRLTKVTSDVGYASFYSNYVYTAIQVSRNYAVELGEATLNLFMPRPIAGHVPNTPVAWVNVVTSIPTIDSITFRASLYTATRLLGADAYMVLPGGDQRLEYSDYILYGLGLLGKVVGLVSEEGAMLLEIASFVLDNPFVVWGQSTEANLMALGPGSVTATGTAINAESASLRVVAYTDSYWPPGGHARLDAAASILYLDELDAPLVSIDLSASATVPPIER